MIERIPQRTLTDCVICALAMVMRGEYTYERVTRDSAKYPVQLPNGKFHGWWEQYLREEGFAVMWRPWSDLRFLPAYPGWAALLHFDIPSIRFAHVVVVDEVGVVDPADGAPDHVEISEYVRNRGAQGAIFDDQFLAVGRLAKAVHA